MALSKINIFFYKQAEVGKKFYYGFLLPIKIFRNISFYIARQIIY